VTSVRCYNTYGRSFALLHLQLQEIYAIATPLVTVSKMLYDINLTVVDNLGPSYTCCRFYNIERRKLGPID